QNSVKGSEINISKHYDLGNDFFSLFLDSTMMYSSAIFKNPHDSLYQGSIHKLETICQGLELTSQDHIIEIGSGWGGFAIYAAQRYGCKVTTTTISKEQYKYIRQKIKDLKLSHKTAWCGWTWTCPCGSPPRCAKRVCYSASAMVPPIGQIGWARTCPA
ncbi:MAG: hypothetical protein EBT37_12215, partial [Betaproteobacteria bacterium]|nr:hypothetical protein [Betaproteobacteria bacterium]